MRKICIITILISLSQLCLAQRFFYIEGNRGTEKLLSEELSSAFQYVTASPVISDYILKSEIGMQSGCKTFMMNLILQDSVSLKTIYQAKEEYTMENLKSDPRIFFSMAVRTFIQKNMNQIILCARDDHNKMEGKWLAPRKDKT